MYILLEGRSLVYNMELCRLATCREDATQSLVEAPQQKEASRYLILEDLRTMYNYMGYARRDHLNSKHS